MTNRTHLILIATLFAASCTKKASTSTTTPVAPATTSNKPNKVTVTTNGSTYTAEGTDFYSMVGTTDNVTVQMIKSSTDANFNLTMNSSVSYDFAINVLQAHGPVNGLGTFTLREADTVYNQFTEKFNGGQHYKIRSGSFSITTASSTKVIGTFTFSLFNVNGTKTVTGTIDANKPI